MTARMKEFTVGAAVVRGLIESLAALGIDVGAAMGTVEFDPSCLEDAEARVPEVTVLALWLAAERLWDGELLSLHAGSRVPIGAFEVLDYLAGTGPTLGDGLRRLTEYSAIANTGMTYAIDETRSDEVRFSMKHPYALELLPPSFIEYLWAIIVTRFRDYLDTRFRPTLFFRHSPRGSLATYHHVLGTVVFDSECTELRIARDQWDLVNDRRDRALSGVLERHARLLLEIVPKTSSPLERVRLAILDSLRRGRPGVEDTASRLGVTVRSLQRLLAAENYSYKRALDEIRAELARAYLSTKTASLSEVTYLLGYSDASTFNRAFRRWTGLTPLEYRRRTSAP
jgi:AraC-like DNA-binding protein